MKEDLTAQGMNMREAVDKSRNRKIWRSLVEASSSAHTWCGRKWKQIMKQTISPFFFLSVPSILCIAVRQAWRSPDIFRQFLRDHSDHTASLDQDLDDRCLRLQSLVFDQSIWAPPGGWAVHSENVRRKANRKVQCIHLIVRGSLCNSTKKGHEKAKRGKMVSGKDAAQEEDGWFASRFSQGMAFYEGILKPESQERLR